MVKIQRIRNNLLFNELHFEILNRCRYTYAHKISKGLEATWASVITLLKEFEELQLIRRVKQGRVFMLDLTPKGEALCQCYSSLMIPLKKEINDINQVFAAGLTDEDKIEKAEEIKHG
jgi:DNA-binding MarR family transcriptional regulator